MTNGTLTYGGGISRSVCVRVVAAVCALLAVLLTHPVKSQPSTPASADYVRTQWTATDGLPVNSVIDMVQTSDGYLWLATYDGLVRFDGQDIKVFRSATYDGLPSNRIVRLSARGQEIWLRTESRHLVRFARDTFRTISSRVRTFRHGRPGTLWIGTENGLEKYQDGSVAPVASGRIRGTVQEIWVADTRALWVGTMGGGVYRRSPTGDVRHLTAKDGLAGMTVGAFASGHGGSVVIGSWNGLQRWREGRRSLAPALNAHEDPLSVFSLQSGVDDTTWAFTSRGVYRYDQSGRSPVVGQSQVFNAAAPPNGPFITDGPNGHMWIGAGHTLYRDGRPVFKTEGLINRFLFDRKGTLWIGTATEGLFRLRSSLFTVYGETDGLASGNVYPVEQRRDGTIWLGTLGGGLARIDSQEVDTFLPRKGGDSLENVWALHESHSGRLWVGGARLCAFEAGQCRRPASEGPIVGTRIRAIYEDREGHLWVGTEEQGLYRCDRRCTGASDHWTQFTPANSGLAHSYVRTIHETPDGTVWVGMNGGGIARYSDGDFASVTTDDGLSSNLVRDLFQDGTGSLWVATEDQGLNRLVLRESDSSLVSSVTVYQKEDGLFDNALHQILDDDRGRMWMSTNRGIFWVEKDELEAFADGRLDKVHSVSYTTSEGLQSREANGGVQPAGIRARDGRLWFATQEGVAVVDPSTVHLTEEPPPLHIERVESRDDVVAQRPLHPVRLAPGQRSFTIKYAGIHLTDPDRVRFRYRLKGLQEAWQTVDDRRHAFFTNVPPGTYTFQVEARVQGGEWAAAPTELSVSVAPFFYETWWFYGLCALGVGLVGYAVVRYWVYRYRRRRQLLKQKVRERTEELTVAKQRAEAALQTVAEQAEELRELDEMKSRLFVNVSHELRTPLSLMVGPIQQILDKSERLGEEREMLEVVQRNARRLRRLVTQILDLARYDAGRLDLTPKRRALAGFVEERLQRLTPLAEARNVDLSSDTSAATRRVTFDPDHLETILANLVRNAITHTPDGGRVDVCATAEEDHVELVVEDTGPGLSEDLQERLFDRFYQGKDRSARGETGLGLALTQALVHLHDGTIDVDSEVGRGSRFIVRWPWRKLAAHHDSERSRGDGAPRTTEWNPEEVLVQGDGGRPIDTAGGSRDPSIGPDDRVHSGDRTTILLVDDNADVRRFLRRLLTPAYRIIEAEDGQRGIERARTILPDLIVADVMMPEMDGFAMVEALRQSRRTTSIPVVMLTARAEQRDQVEGLEDGANAYVTKPFDAEVLRAQIDRLLESRRELRERLQEEAPKTVSPTSETQTPSSSIQETFEDRVYGAVSEHLADPDFTVQRLADEVGVVRRTVTRKVKEAFGVTPSAFIRTRRVERAAELLRDDAGTVSEVAYAVGFNSLSYFSRSFKEHFGVSPSEFVEHA